MDGEHTISGLLRKRADLVHQMKQAEATIRELRLSLAHLQTTLRLFDPDAEPIRGETAMTLVPDLHLRVLDVLRTAAEPVTSWDITRVITGQLGIDRAYTSRIDKAVGACLRRNAGGLTQRIGHRPARWKVA